MARNPKQDANLRPIKKGELSKEEAKERGSKGGKKSGEVRRLKRDVKNAVNYFLNLAAQGASDTNLGKYAVPEENRTNLMSVIARLHFMAVDGDLDAMRLLMELSGNTQAEHRKDMEMEAKMKALGQNPDENQVSVNMTDEDGRTDVVIYIPKMMDETECDAEEDEADKPEKKDE